MTEHLSEAQLNDWVDGTLAGDDQSVRQHLGNCEHCRTAVAELTSLLANVADLTRESDPKPWVRGAVLVAAHAQQAPAYTPRTSPRARWRVHAERAFAAGLVGLSFAAGSWWRSTQHRGPGNDRDVASAVQRTGTAYVAALVSLEHSTSVADSATVRQGREAAMAALQAATVVVVRSRAQQADAPRITLF